MGECRGFSRSASADRSTTQRQTHSRDVYVSRLSHSRRSCNCTLSIGTLHLRSLTSSPIPSGLFTSNGLSVCGSPLHSHFKQELLASGNGCPSPASSPPRPPSITSNGNGAVQTRCNSLVFAPSSGQCRQWTIFRQTRLYSCFICS